MTEKAKCKNCTNEKEMAKIQCDSCKKYTGESEDCNSAECLFIRKKYANELVKQGYRKIPEGSVVLTKEEYVENLYSQFKDGYKQARKETAKEFASKVKECKEIKELVELGYIVSYVELCKAIDEIAKKYGVEE